MSIFPNDESVPINLKDYEKFFTPTAMDELSAAIIRQAIDDYVDTLTYDPESIKDFPSMLRKIPECEQFFRSEYFVSLSNLDGEQLIQKSREIASRLPKKWYTPPKNKRKKKVDET